MIILFIFMSWFRPACLFYFEWSADSRTNDDRKTKNVQFWKRIFSNNFREKFFWFVFHLTVLFRKKFHMCRHNHQFEMNFFILIRVFRYLFDKKKLNHRMQILEIEFFYWILLSFFFCWSNFIQIRSWNWFLWTWKFWNSFLCEYEFKIKFIHSWIRFTSTDCLKMMFVIETFENISNKMKIDETFKWWMIRALKSYVILKKTCFQFWLSVVFFNIFFNNLFSISIISMLWNASDELKIKIIFNWNR